MNIKRFNESVNQSQELTDKDLSELRDIFENVEDQIDHCEIVDIKICNPESDYFIFSLIGDLIPHFNRKDLETKHMDQFIGGVSEIWKNKISFVYFLVENKTKEFDYSCEEATKRYSKYGNLTLIREENTKYSKCLYFVKNKEEIADRILKVYNHLRRRIERSR